MRSRVTRAFRERLARLPASVHEQAARAYDLWRSDPQHPGLQFKRVSQSQAVYSVRIGIGYRVLGLRDGDQVTWYWIGAHAEYDEVLKRL